ncbi:hypothetical protein ACOSQ3_001787 [Xanthoceras sorbifolium]
MSVKQVQRIDSYRQLNPTPFFFKLCLIRLHTTEIVSFQFCRSYNYLFSNLLLLVFSTNLTWDLGHFWGISVHLE